MKNIVVKILVVVTGLLILPTGLMAQKPAIDLISTHQRFRHPEAIIDTGNTANLVLRIPESPEMTPAGNQDLTNNPGEKKRRQTGPSPDTIFRNDDSSRNTQEKTLVNISLFIRKYRSFRTFIYITALK